LSLFEVGRRKLAALGDDDEAVILEISEAVGAALDGQRADFVFDLGGDLKAKSHEMVDDHAHDMKAVGDDPGVGETFANQGAIRVSHPAPFGRGEVNVKLISALASKHTIAFYSNSIIHRGHVAGFPRLMSPFFDQEPELGLK
jgi:hypothetical protein